MIIIYLYLLSIIKMKAFEFVSYHSSQNTVPSHINESINHEKVSLSKKWFILDS